MEAVLYSPSFEIILLNADYGDVVSDIDGFKAGMRLAIAAAHDLTDPGRVNITDVRAGSVVLAYVVELKRLVAVNASLIEMYPDSLKIVRGMRQSREPTVTKVAPARSEDLNILLKDPKCDAHKSQCSAQRYCCSNGELSRGFSACNHQE